MTVNGSDTLLTSRSTGARAYRREDISVQHEFVDVIADAGDGLVSICPEFKCASYTGRTLIASDFASIALTERMTTYVVTLAYAMSVGIRDSWNRQSFRRLNGY